jgi:xylulokinase
MGERTPYLDPCARGALVGITAQHHRGHVVRAILEGVAFSLRDSFEIFRELKIPAQSVRLGGGGARSELWRQIQADIYGMSVEIVEAEEGPAYGAALLAGVGSGAWPSVEEACDKAVRVAQRISPDAASARRLNLRYAVYRQMYPALRGIFHESQNS